jgi:radical SAM-linked protein
MRVRLKFAKNEAVRYIGHLDLYRAWERIIRRAGLPLAYSQGFNPHPRLNLASALPLGFTSACELLDLWLETPTPLPEVQRLLQAACPPGIEILQAEAVDDREPALPGRVRSAEFTITLLDDIPDLQARIDQLLAAASLPRSRRDKAYDLRPLVEALEALPPDEERRPRLRMVLSAREGATGRPEELLDALGVQAGAARVHRTNLFLSMLAYPG